MAEIFFVSKNVPNLLKSAGDIRAFRMLKILRKKHNVHVFARSADYGESDVKSIGCESHLTGNPQTTYVTYSNVKQPDIVILSHWTVASEMLEFVRATSPQAKIYIDTIDVEFLRLSRKLAFDPTKIDEKEVNRVRASELGVYRKADGLIVASEQDKVELKKHGEFNLIDLPCLYSINNEYRPSEGKNSYIICNWTHEPNIVSTKYLCEEIIPMTDLMFYIVGKHPPEDIKKYESSKIVVNGAEYEINKFLFKMNMLLCPVFYGAGMNGKILEAISFGIPVITSSLGALPIGLIHEESAMVADDTKSFINCVNQVLIDKDLREKLSVNGKEVAKKFTIETWQDKFLEEIK
jgi:glycosyltransferase involved in cell wall biosynthesis